MSPRSSSGGAASCFSPPPVWAAEATRNFRGSLQGPCRPSAPKAAPRPWKLPSPRTPPAPPPLEAPLAAQPQGGPRLGPVLRVDDVVDEQVVAGDLEGVA